MKYLPLAAFLLVGCAHNNTQTDVYAAATALAAADTLAIQYVTLPLCGPTHAKPLCSEASVSAQIKQAAQAAHDAVKAAEKTAADPNAPPGAMTAALAAANAAIAALMSLTPKV